MYFILTLKKSHKVQLNVIGNCLQGLLEYKFSLICCVFHTSNGFYYVSLTLQRIPRLNTSFEEREGMYNGILTFTYGIQLNL